MGSAAHFEDKGYLRVLTPQTTDGVNLKYNKLGNPIFKETRLPLTAEKHMKLQNESLPDHLKNKLQIVTPEPVAVDGGEEKGKRGPGRPRVEKETEQV
jgi:hypothetical protein